MVRKGQFHLPLQHLYLMVSVAPLGCSQAVQTVIAGFPVLFPKKTDLSFWVTTLGESQLQRSDFFPLTEQMFSRSTHISCYRKRTLISLNWSVSLLSFVESQTILSQKGPTRNQQIQLLSPQSAIQILNPLLKHGGIAFVSRVLQ